MGATVRTEQGTRLAYVFYGAPGGSGNATAVSIALVLACAFAQKSGHVFIPNGGHSAPA